MAAPSDRRPRLATVWLAGCSGCHMSLLDLDERLLDLTAAADLVYSPLVDAKRFPDAVDVALVEGAVASTEQLQLARTIRERSKAVVSLGDCAVTGNIPAIRNRATLGTMLARIFPGQPAEFFEAGITEGLFPSFLPQVLPLHRVIAVDCYLPGCPPDPERIWTALTALLRGEPVVLDEAMRRFG